LLEENDRLGRSEAARDWITVSTSMVGESQEFNLLNYFVPSMAIFFLMFTVFDGARSILQEERDGTLHRLMTTPTSRTEILLGKISGVFMTGMLQFAVLVAISGLVFDVDWGNEPLGILLMVLATVAASTSLGAFVVAFARNNNQAGVIGTAITLIFAILGGNFIDFRAIPAWLTPVSRLTINRWALEGFTNLTLLGQSLSDVLPNILVLFGLGGVFFTLSLMLFNRRFVG
jgi:ABC-2 type transport system permease protein